MQKFILSALLASVAMPAFAADMPVKAPVRVAPIYSDWTGFYILGYGGYSWGKISPDDFDVADIDDRLHNPKPKGMVFGFGGGYNWQYGRFVGGIEVDYGFSNEKETQSLSDPITETVLCEIGQVCAPRVVGRFDTTLSSKIDALGSARVRAGFLLMDNLLAYGTAGLGFARSQATVAFSACNLQNNCETLSATAKANNFGWVAGGGLEYKGFLLPNLGIRVEYLHFDFGSTTYAFQTPFLVGVNVNAKTTDDVVRGALILRFGEGTAR